MTEIQQNLRKLLESQELQQALADAFLTGCDSITDFREIDLAEHVRHARGITVNETPFEDFEI
jgi:hypothetical protein